MRNEYKERYIYVSVVGNRIVTDIATKSREEIVAHNKIETPDMTIVKLSVDGFECGCRLETELANSMNKDEIESFVLGSLYRIKALCNRVSDRTLLLSIAEMTASAIVYGKGDTVIHAA